MHTLFDGRKYIGITSLKPKYRWSNGNGYKTSHYFFNTIQKYGWSSFKHEVLFEGLTLEQACNKEKALIKLFNTTDSKYGFNLTTGGICYEVISKTKEKISKAETSIDISKEDLEEQFIAFEKSYKECADYFGCSETTIFRLVKKYNLKRSHKKVLYFDISKEELVYQYIVLGKTAEQCTEYFGVTLGVIKHRIKLYSLKRPTKAEVLAKRYLELYEMKCLMGYSISRITEELNENRKDVQKALILANIVER